MIPLKCQKFDADIFSFDDNMNEVSSDEEMECFMLSVENSDDNDYPCQLEFHYQICLFQ
jgi:hypothetical protein